MQKEQDIDFKHLEETVALIVTKKELPYNKDLSFFGWDGRYELNSKKGALFERKYIHALNLLGLKSEPYNTDYDFIDFDQLLRLYEYAECILDLLYAHRHSDDVKRNIQQIIDLSDALNLAKKQKKEFDDTTIKNLQNCIRKG